jgi:hypothetical protein
MPQLDWAELAADEWLRYSTPFRPSGDRKSSMCSRFWRTQHVPATPDTLEATVQRSQPRRRWTLLAVVAVTAILIGLIGGLAISAGHDEPSREEVVAKNGAEVMPFDLDATTHVFDATSFGGVQQVVADDPADAEQIALIRAHLGDEVERFRTGDFGDPATIHGHDMPGLTVLESRSADLEITFQELPAGAEVTYRSKAHEVVAAVHDWFAAQLADHGGHAATH